MQDKLNKTRCSDTKKLHDNKKAELIIMKDNTRSNKVQTVKPLLAKLTTKLKRGSFVYHYIADNIKEQPLL